MPVQIVETSPEYLSVYASIPIKLEVKSRFEVELLEGGLGGMLLRQVPVEKPYEKDYDSFGETPVDWAGKFDLTKWGFFLAMESGKAVGAATVAFDTPGVIMLENRHDLSVLWDLRSHPAHRGVGIPLFRYAADWSKQRGCKQMKVETQNTNVPACRFYKRMGCQLGEIHRFGYAAISSLAEELMLNWYYTL